MKLDGFRVYVDCIVKPTADIGSLLHSLATSYMKQQVYGDILWRLRQVMSNRYR